MGFAESLPSFVTLSTFLLVVKCGVRHILWWRCACAPLAPGYSDIYPDEGLSWGNTNKALIFRSDILNLHSLSDLRLKSLIKSLENCEVDDYTDITTLIGIEFETTPCGAS